MNLLKLITAYCMFSYASLIPADKAATPQDTLIEAPILPEVSEKNQQETAKPASTEAKPKDVATKQDITEIKTPAKQEETVKKDELKQWQDHLKTLLIKGAFWDSSSNSPTTDWTSSTENLAEGVLTKDISQAEELKTSFGATINEKFLTIEKGTNVLPIVAIINEFNKKIDVMVQKLSGVKTTEEKQAEKPQELKEEVPAQAEITIPETPKEQPTPEEKIELTAEQKAANKQEKKLKQAWKDCLESIKSMGTSPDEIPGMIDEISLIVTQLVEQFPSELNSFKGEFLDALKERRENALIQFNEQSVRRIIDLFDTMQILEQGLLFDDRINIINTPPIPTSQSETKQPAQPISQQKTQSNNASSQTIIIQEQGQDNSYFIAEQKIVDAQRAQAQKSLAAKMQKTAQQKSEAEKAETQRGILSSIAKAILPESWTGEDETEKTIKMLLNEQILEVEKLMDKDLSDDIKNKIKLAYELFQKTILDFNKPKYWNNEETRPNKTWIKNMTMPSLVLIQYKIMSLDTIRHILEQTFENMSVKGQKTTEAELVQAIKKEEEKQREIYLTEKKKEQKIHDEKLQEIENKRLAIINQERAVIELEQKKEEEKQAVFTALERLKSEWVNLLTEISHNKTATDDHNKAWTTQALNITKDMLKLVPIVGTNNQQDIISKHKIDFSRALLAQGSNAENINIHANMDIFNKKVHEL